MRKIIFFSIVSILISLFMLNSISISSEIKTLDDLKNSSFYKKYPQKDPDSWPLKAGGYSYSTYIDLKIDKNSLVLLEVLTKSKENPIIYRYSIMFHAGYMKQMKAFFYDFFSAVDSSLDAKAVIDYIQKHAAVKVPKSADAPKQTFGKYSVRVSNVSNAVTISIEKRAGT